MQILQEFKTFISRGNAVDLAIAVIIGASFGKIVSSLVNDVLMPPIGILLGGVNFSDLGITLKQAVGNQPAVIIKYGAFINTVIDFLIVSAVIFIVVKALNVLKGNQTPAPTTKECPECEMQIPIGAKRCGHCTSQLK